MLRTNPLVTTLWSGINLQGEYALPPSSGKWGYNLYSFSPESNPEHPGAGGRVWWSQKNESLKVGLSTQVSKLGPLTAEVLGGDLEIRAKPFAVISEYAHGYTHSSVDPWSIYVEPSLMIYQEVVRLYLFADYADSPYNKTGSEVAGAFLDPYKQWEYGTGVNWLPTSYVRLRLGLTYHDYVGGTAVINGQNRNYYGIDVSAGVTF